MQSQNFGQKFGTKFNSFFHATSQNQTHIIDKLNMFGLSWYLCSGMKQKWDTMKPVKVILMSGYELQAKFSSCFAEYGLFQQTNLSGIKEMLNEKKHGLLEKFFRQSWFSQRASLECFLHIQKVPFEFFQKRLNIDVQFFFLQRLCHINYGHNMRFPNWPMRPVLYTHTRVP